MGDPTHLLTTGQAAKLCSVTRDTVLKWIKRGGLSPARTAGGHYRIAPKELERFLPALARRRDKAAAEMPNAESAAHSRCWEYLSGGGGGDPRVACRNCLAYQVEARWCFRLKRLDSLNFARCGCGPEDCGDCPYYRQLAGLPARVLLISSSPGFGADLAARPDVETRSAETVYEAAQAVAEFHPAIAVVDGDDEAFEADQLVAGLLADQRAAGVRVVLAVGRRARRNQWRRPGDRLPLHMMRKPLDAAGVLSVLPAVEDLDKAAFPGGPGEAECRQSHHVFENEGEKGKEQRI